ncbi:phospho-N-acetylmuramoyl-pentapeptide-transferase, partial [Bacillus smithii]
FELGGWSEWRVVVTFWTASLICAGLGIYIGVWD